MKANVIHYLQYMPYSLFWRNLLCLNECKYDICCKRFHGNSRICNWLSWKWCISIVPFMDSVCATYNAIRSISHGTRYKHGKNFEQPVWSWSLTLWPKIVHAASIRYNGWLVNKVSLKKNGDKNMVKNNCTDRQSHRPTGRTSRF